MDSALLYALYGCAAVTFICWALSTITKEYSWVDRIWSIIPVCYAVWFAYCAGFSDLRVNVMAFLVAAWGARLTFNFARKGGYAKGGEDYRWPILRAKLNAWQWELFSIFFIAIFQQVLLLGITLPIWRSLPQAGTPAFGTLDVVAALLFTALLIGETVADQQQWNFYEARKAKKERGEEITEPFLTKGLFSLSRHPNFFCEQGQWWALYLFSVAATGVWLHWTLLGAITLSGLFHGSTNFTEEISAKKYPSYAEYQKRTSRLMPWFPGK
jgi:steroid 5-alpha reductase family enzyme